MRYALARCKSKMNSDRTVTFTGSCVVTGKPYSVTVSQMGIHKYEHGMKIQDAFPELSNDDRLFLIYGLSPEGWEQIFGKDKEESFSPIRYQRCGRMPVNLKVAYLKRMGFIHQIYADLNPKEQFRATIRTDIGHPTEKDDKDWIVITISVEDSNSETFSPIRLPTDEELKDFCDVFFPGKLFERYTSKDQPLIFVMCCRYDEDLIKLPNLCYDRSNSDKVMDDATRFLPVQLVD